jgi:hypothetical protein
MHVQQDSNSLTKRSSTARVFRRPNEPRSISLRQNYVHTLTRARRSKGMNNKQALANFGNNRTTNGNRKPRVRRG